MKLAVRLLPATCVLAVLFVANLALAQNVYVSGFVAQTSTEGSDGDDRSYRAQYNYAADRYGLTLDRIEVQQNFNPEIGVLRRENFRKNTVGGRFSPRPAGSRFIRKYYYEGISTTSPTTATCCSRAPPAPTTAWSCRTAI